MKISTSSKIKYLPICFGWLLVWEAVYLCVGNKLLLSGPVDTLVRLGEDVISRDFWITIASSFLHIATGFTVGLILGILLAVCSYKHKLFEDFVFPVIGFLKAAPVAAFVVLFLIWWHSDVLSVAICICVVTPQIYVPFLEGLRKTDLKLIKMADVFDIHPVDRFFYIFRPSLKPFMESALKISAAMAWKSGVAAEVIGTPSFSIGEGLYLSKITLDTAGVFSWTFVIILISILCEKVLLKLLDFLTSVSVGTHGKGYIDYEMPQDNTSDNSAKTQGITLKADKINFSYSDAAESDGKCHKVLADVSFEYYGGNVYVLNSPSGSGKSTLLNIIAGLLVPDSGKLVIENLKVSYCFQEEVLCEDFSALKNVELVCEEDKAYEYLKPLFTDSSANESEVRSLLDKKVSELSGGQRRRVSIARAVAKNADIVLLDEPYNGLDEDNIIKVKEYLHQYCGDKIVIIASHIDCHEE